MIVLGIDTSCDDTCCGCINEKKILSNVVLSQELHSEYGGVIPELAARDHIKNITKIVKKATEEVGLNNIAGIGVTYGPGLIGSLLVGLSFAKSLSYGLNIPFYGVNHLESHIFSLFFDNNITFPFIALVVSGAHTEFIMVKEKGDYKTLGCTLDDAAGEAFDKVGRLLGLNYPCGPGIQKLSKLGNKEAVKFPIPKVSEYNFSFSGLKTAVLYYLKKNVDAKIEDVAASFQEAVVDFIIEKILLVCSKFNIYRIGICGGVSANERLREKILEYKNKLEIYFPRKELCTDNGVMVALCAHHYLSQGKKSNYDLKPYSILPL